MKNENARAGRLTGELLDRFLVFSERMLHVVEHLREQRRPERVVSQVVGAGTSPGAQVHEANAAMTRPDFVKSLAIATKELAECGYWLKLIARMQWVAPARIDGLFQECDGLSRILHAMIIRTRKRPL